MTTVTQPSPEVTAHLAATRAGAERFTASIRALPVLPADDALPKAVKQQLDAYNGERAEQVERGPEVVAPLLAAAAALDVDDGADDMTSFFALADSVKVSRLEILQAAAQLAKRAEALAREAYDEMKPLADKARLDADGTLVAIKDDLEKIGQGVTATVAGALGTNAGAAEQQFTFLAKQNVRYREANAAAMQAKSRAEAFQTAARAARRAADDLGRQVVVLALREASV